MNNTNAFDVIWKNSERGQKNVLNQQTNSQQLNDGSENFWPLKLIGVQRNCLKLQSN